MDLRAMNAWKKFEQTGSIAALAAIKQESGSWKWALFAACYTTGLAWLVAFSVYQIGGMFV